MENTEINNSEELLQKIQRIYAEREEEYQKYEESYQRRCSGLQEILQQISEGKAELEKQNKILEKKRRSLFEQEQELERKIKEKEDLFLEESRKLEEEKEKINTAFEEVKATKEELLLKHNLELETVRNEELKLRRLTSDYEYKISLLDQKNAGIQSIDPEEYIPVSEHNKMVQALKDERAEFMKRILELTGRLEQYEDLRTSDSEQEMLHENEFEEAMEKEEDIVSESKKIRTEEEDYSFEELTAEVLKTYMEKNEPKYAGLSVLHSEEGEQLHAEYGGVYLRFIFADPCRFDISAKRKENYRLHKILDKMNKQYPGVKFHYEEGFVYATGYFTSEISPRDLMDRTGDLISCFNLE